MNTETLHHGLDRELSKKILDEENFQAYKKRNLFKTIDDSETKLSKKKHNRTKVKFERSDSKDDDQSVSSFEQFESFSEMNQNSKLRKIEK